MSPLAFFFFLLCYEKESHCITLTLLKLSLVQVGLELIEILPISDNGGLGLKACTATFSLIFMFLNSIFHISTFASMFLLNIHCDASVICGRNVQALN